METIGYVSNSVTSNGRRTAAWKGVDAHVLIGTVSDSLCLKRLREGKGTIVPNGS